MELDLNFSYICRNVKNMDDQKIIFFMSEVGRCSPRYIKRNNIVKTNHLYHEN